MALSVNDFGKAVVAAGLMSADEVKALWDGLPADARPKNGTAFGKLLEARGKVTAYQAAELAAGNGASLVLGDYVILAKIGAGGMGQVFKAQHRRMKRLVAIKLLPPAMTKDEAAVKRFQREVEAAAKLSHPNIVTAHDAGEVRGAHYLVMEYVEGKDLSHLVKSRGPLPVAEAVNYITQAARGLAYAHSRGVVHRDIKPANLLLDAEGTVKILDMGLARFDEANPAMVAAEEGLTQSGQVMGTVDYMAPEQAFDTRQADARADIYSLGCSLYRLLIGENVYSGDTLMQKFLAHREKPIPSLHEKRPEVSEALDAVFRKMMAKLPEDRYQPTSLLVADLEACAAPMGSTANLAASQATSTFVPNSLPGKSPATEVEDGMTAALGNQLMRSLPDSRTPPRDDTFNSSINDRTQRGRKGQVTRVAGGKKPPWNNPIVLSAAGAAAVLIVLLGIWVTVRDKDGKPVAKVEVPEEGSVQVKTIPEVKSKVATKPNVKPAQTFASSGAVAQPSAGDYALDFDGQTSYVEIPSLSRDEAGDFTLEAYVKLHDWVSSKLILQVEGKASCQMYILYIPGRTRTFHGMDETGKTIMSSQVALPLDQRVHLAYSVGKEDERLYLNGKEVSRDSRGRGPANRKGRTGLWIGAHPNEEGKIHYFVTGTIDEMRISNTARYTKDFIPAPRNEPDAATLALYHFDEGAGDSLKDSSGHGHHGKIRGAEWVRADGSAIPPSGTAASADFVSLFSGRDLTGWTQIGEQGWSVQNGALVGKTSGAPGWLMSDKEYANFELELEYKLPAGGNSGVFLRAWPQGPISGANFHEVQLIDNADPKYANLQPVQKNGAIFGWRGPSRTPPCPAGVWHRVSIFIQGDDVQVAVNDVRVVDGHLIEGRGSPGHIGLQLYTPEGVEFRNIRIRELPSTPRGPFDSAQAKAYQAAWAKHLGTQVETVDSVGAKMILIPPGQFSMGSSDEQVEAALKAAKQISADSVTKDRIQSSERPQHRVVLTKPFRMSATEVTIGQFKKFVAAARYQTEAEKAAEPKTYLNPGYDVTDESPVAGISWNDAVAYCSWLSEQERATYRLPTEAEWEYACRAGTTTQYSFGDDVNLLAQFGWYGKNAGGKTNSVGTKQPNAFGLHDMHGNLYEWCQDFYDEKWYEKGSFYDPKGPDSGSSHVLRGGPFYNIASYCRSAYRNHSPQAYRYLYSYGFRCVRELDGSASLTAGTPAMSLSAAPATASAGFVSLFNGKDLTGWKTHPEHAGNWRVESGILVGTGEHTTYLFSNRDDYSNFHLRVETRIESGGSAGISCRSPFDGKSVGRPNRPRVLGYLAKINADSTVDPRKTGSLYVIEPTSFIDGNVIGGSAVKPGEWFTLDVTVQGNHVVIQVNGQTTTDFLDSRNLFSKGHIALQVMSGEKKVEFRKIEIKELGAGGK